METERELQLPGFRLPDFLVIGAMKCGTTSLYHDLRSWPGLCLAEKEMNALLHDSAAVRYAEAFRGAGAGQLLGDVSPDYAKRPESDGVAARAKALLAGRPVRLIYLVREPLSRLVSHHAFLSTQQGRARQGMPRGIEEALAAFPSLVDYSRYAWQLEPWVEAFGSEALLVLRFEDYVADRAETLRKVAGFLGQDFDGLPSPSGRVHNPTAGRPVATPGWRRLLDAGLYRRWIRPWFTPEARDRLRHWLLPKAPGRPPPPNRATVARLLPTLKADGEALRLLLGRERPLWDLDSALERYPETPA